MLADPFYGREVEMDEIGKKILEELEIKEYVRVEIGSDLIRLADPDQGGGLMKRIGELRRKLSLEFGFLIRPVRVVDHLGIGPNEYAIHLHDNIEARGAVDPLRLIAMEWGGKNANRLPGAHVKEPVYGWDSVWIEPAERDQAKKLGYLVVEPDAVISTHLMQVLRAQAYRLIGYEETYQILWSLWKTHPRLVDALVPESLTLVQVRDVLCTLLQEQISIRPILTIAETLVAYAQTSQDTQYFAAAVRKALLLRVSLHELEPEEKHRKLMVLDEKLETMLLLVAKSGLPESDNRELITGFIEAFLAAVSRMQQKGLPCLLVVGLELKDWLTKLVEKLKQDAQVLSYDTLLGTQGFEIAETLRVEGMEYL